MFVVTKLAEVIIYYILLCMYYPLYLCGLLLIKFKLILQNFKLETGWNFVYQGVMKPLSKRSKVNCNEELWCLTSCD